MEPYPSYPDLAELERFAERLTREGVFGGEVATRVPPARESATADARSPSSSSVTLAQLYLAQGHRSEARRMLEDLLAREPRHVAGRRLMDRIAGRSGPLSAADLLGDAAREGNSRHRRRSLLEAYLERLEAASQMERGH